MFTTGAKRRRAAAVQNLAEFGRRVGGRASVLECGAPAPLFKGDATKEANRRKKRQKTKERKADQIGRGR
jgi:hypothetical protein